MSKSTVSLKSLTPQLARALGMKPAALYERQRALVRAGLLHMRPGRGPGSGVPADAKSVAMLLISVLATGSLSEVEEQTLAIANLKSVDGRCPVTGKKTFAAALTATVNSNELVDRAFSVSAARSGSGAMASITFSKLPFGEAPFPPDFERDMDKSDFGLPLYDFYLEDSACLTVEASMNLRGTLRGVELGGAR
jgi:hypothetical protein